MSYCRISATSDIYLFEMCPTSAHRELDIRAYECGWCILANYDRTVLWTHGEVLAHLKEHARAGHKVPTRVMRHFALFAKVDQNAFRASSHRWFHRV